MANENNTPKESIHDNEVIEDLEPVDDAPIPPRIAPPKLDGNVSNPIHSVLSSDDVDFIGKVLRRFGTSTFVRQPPREIHA